jgi:hypothetical protein
MRTTLLIIALFYGSLCYGQDWQPFPIGETLYYSQQRGDSTVIERVDAAVWPNAEGAVTLHTPLCSDWAPYLYEEIIVNLDNIYSDKPVYIRKVDSVYTFTYIMSVDKWVYSLDFPFVFDLKSGERYTSEKTDMMCVVHDTMTVLGMPDSVRIFELYDDNDTAIITLSKRYGIVSFPNFLDPSLELGPLNLVGYADSTLTTGYKQPQFDDYFDLHPGDLIYWYRIWHRFVGGETVRDTTYLVDTLL